MKNLFGGVIAIVLLGLYVLLVERAIRIALCLADSACKTYKAGDFNDSMAQAVAVIGGLVSALVISELAIAQPGKPPVPGSLRAQTSPGAVKVVSVVSVTYVAVWIAAGLAAFIVSLYHPTVLQPLTSLGQAWLGLAVAAAYAYFGLKAPG